MLTIEDYERLHEFDKAMDQVPLYGFRADGTFGELPKLPPTTPEMLEQYIERATRFRGHISKPRSKKVRKWSTRR